MKFKDALPKLCPLCRRKTYKTSSKDELRRVRNGDIDSIDVIYVRCYKCTLRLVYCQVFDNRQQWMFFELSFHYYDNLFMVYHPKSLIIYSGGLRQSTLHNVDLDFNDPDKFVNRLKVILTFQ